MVPQHIKKQENPSIALLVANFPGVIQENEINSIDREWKTLPNVPEEVLNFSTDFESFWINVSQLKNNAEEFCFPLLTRLVNHVRILPHSTATVERVFSTINLNKTKTRNRLSTSTICGVLLTKNFFVNNKCYDFEVHQSIIKKITKDIIYTKEDTVESDT